MPTSLTRRSVNGAGVGALLAAAAPGSAAAAGTAPVTLVVAQTADILSMNPMVDGSLLSHTVYRNVFDQLTQIDADGRVVPWLATAWEATPDQKTWTYTLRQNVKFHNGKPVTADDVVWTYDTIRNDQRSAMRPYVSLVANIEKLADDKIRFHLSSPFVVWDRQTTLISIMPKNGELGPDGQPLPVGCGAFKFVRWVRDDRVELERNPDWWGGPPKIDKLVFRSVPSEAARASALVSGEINVVPLLPPSQVARIEARDDVRLVKVQSNRVVYCGVNVTIPVLADKKLRQAMDHAIDREAITQRLIRGYGVPIGQINAPKVFGYDPSLTPASYDPVLAKQLVAESSYKGEKIVFTYTTSQIAYADQVTQAIANYLQAVGINIELQPLEAAATTQLAITRKFPGIFISIFAPSIMDADLGILIFYQKGFRGYWIDDQVQTLATEQRAEGNLPRRLEIIGEISKRSRDESGMLFLYNEIWTFGMSKGVKWEPSPDGALVFQTAEFTSP